MKRSEMREIIQKELLKTVGGDTAKYMAEDILFLIEKAGMLPPRIKAESKAFVTNPETGERGEFKSWTYKSLWEPEDEEK